MDYLKSMAGGSGNKQSDQPAPTSSTSTTGQTQDSGSGGFLGGIGNKLNSAAGGGRESEKNEDMVDKGELIAPSSFMTTSLTVP